MPLDSATFESLLIAPGTGHLSPNTDSVFASLADGCPVHGKPNQLTDNYDVRLPSPPVFLIFLLPAFFDSRTLLALCLLTIRLDSSTCLSHFDS